VAFAVPRERVAYFGHSLGSAVAAELAELHPPAALLLQAPFSSARAMARLIISPPVVLAWRAISRIHFDTERLVASLEVPVSVAHGTRDRIVPIRMGTDVYQAARRKGQLLVVESAGHNNVAEVAGEKYWEWFRAALQFSEVGDPKQEKA
jgi:pimeloyl-ACP methyl ester carboxylesterase